MKNILIILLFFGLSKYSYGMEVIKDPMLIYKSYSLNNAALLFTKQYCKNTFPEMATEIDNMESSWLSRNSSFNNNWQEIKSTFMEETFGPTIGNQLMKSLDDVNPDLIKKMAAALISEKMSENKETCSETITQINNKAFDYSAYPELNQLYQRKINPNKSIKPAR